MDDKHLEIIIGNLLRAGVLLSAAIVAIGGALYLAQHDGQSVNYKTFSAGGPDTRTLAGIASSATHLHPEGLIALGLVFLIATPIARVVFAVIGFSMEHDRLYAFVSLIVLAVLLFSLMHAT